MEQTEDGPRVVYSPGRALRVALIYLLAGLLWILASDRILEALASDPELLTRLQTLKGWAFVVFSAALLWALVRHEIHGLEQGERRFRALVEQSLAGVGVVQDGRIVYANPKLAGILGLTMRELLALEHPEEMVTEPHRAAVADLWAGGPELGGPESVRKRHRRTLRVRAADGKERPVEMSFQEIDWRGRPARIALVLDRSGEEALEEQLRHAQRMEAIGRLTGAVAHDFNNLLTAVNGPIELALLELDETHPVRADLTEALKAVESASRLTRQLLTFSRKRVSRPRPVDVNDALTALRPMVERLAGKGISVAFEVGPPDGRVLIDPAHLEQVVVNLVVNARDAMPEGGALTIRTRIVPGDPQTLRHRDGLSPGAHSVLEVADTGHGMSEDTRRRAFEPFFTTREKGTGLGLSTVFGIVRQAEGFIRVNSGPGQGTTMQVHLPVTDAEVEEAAPAEDVSVSRTGPAAGRSSPVERTIMVVEDEASVRRVFERALGREGFRVLAAGDGTSALEIMQAHDGDIHLLITDVMLPGMSGVDLAAEVSRRHPGASVLYASGYSEENLSRQMRMTPELDFLEKPFQIDQLLTLVRRALGDEARA